MSNSGWTRGTRLGAIATAVVASAIVIVPGAPALAASIQVTTTADTIDAAAGCSTVTLASLPGPDNVTSLREAVCAANSNPGPDAIIFNVFGTFVLTGAANEDNGQSGDLDIKESVSVSGNGVGNTIIDGGGIERIFDVFPSAAATFNLNSLTLQHGDTRAASLFKEAGAVYLHNNVTSIFDTVHILNNFSAANGAIENRGTLTITNSLISGNQTIPATGSVVGGGLFNAGALTIDNSTISNNTVRGEGGGIATTTGAAVTVVISNTTFSNNTASVTGGGNGNGGAISTTGNDGTVNLVNVTISGNHADNNGGGAYLASPSATGNVNLTNVTVTANTADADGNAAGTGGGIHRNSSTVTMRNTIVAGNLDSPGTNHDVAGTFSAASVNNLIGNGTGMAGITNGVNGNQVGTAGSPINPVLGALANNGGSTFTHALLAGSPAINTGTNTGCPATDQRGVARPSGGTCDIGAFELVDTTPPDTSITANPTNPSANVNPSFSFTGSDPGGSGVAGFECQLDGGGFSSCTSPKSYVGLADGSHTFQVRAIDGASNTDPTPASYTWVIDTTAPDTSITSNPTNPVASTSAAFSFTGSDVTGTGVASFECQLDGGGFVACTSPQSYSSLSQGSHTFQVRAIDAVGNVDGTPASFTWLVDTIGPDTTITVQPSNPSANSNPSFSFTGSDPGGSGVAGFECQLDGGGFVACTSPQGYSGVSEGSHTFQVRAVDALGNVDATPDSYTWSIDVTAPDTNISVGPPDPTNSPNAGFSFTGSDPGGSGVASFECKLDAGSFGACTSPAVYSSLTDGSHTFEVRAIDAAGNVDASPATRTWVIDTAAPTVSITAHPSNPSNSAAPSFSFDGDGTGTSVTFECQLDGGGYGPCAGPTAYSSLGDGPHTFDVRATDAAGNVSAPASFSWVIDTAEPTTMITSNPPNPSSSPDATFTFTGDDGGGSGVASFLCQLDGGGYSPCTSPKTYTGLTDGSHTFQARAVDAAGNEDHTATYTWAIDTGAPDTLITSAPPALTASTSANITFAGNDVGGTGVASFECALDGGSFAACTSPKSLTGLANGSHTFQVRAIDSAGNADASPASATWTVNTAAGPTLTATKTATGTFQPGGAITYTIVVTNNGSIAQADNPGDELTDVLPASLQLVSTTASAGTAIADTANRTVHWNGSLAPSASVTITISATILSSASAGQTISNQATVAFDADDNGTNESSVTSDNPSTGGADATSFALAPVPTTTTTTTVPSGGLPPTGSDHTRSGLMIALVLVGIGVTMVGVRRRRAH